MFDLEKYMIPAEEGILGSLWPAITNKIRNAINTKKQNKTPTVFEKMKSESDMKSIKNKEYYDNTQQVISRMKEECPEVINKEMALRKSEIKRIIPIINNISKKYQVAGITITSEYIKNYLKDPENAMQPYPNDDWEINCEFLINPFPSKSPKIYQDYTQWAWDSSYCLEVLDYDIHFWAEDTYGDKYRNGEINVRDSENTTAFYDTLNKIEKEITQNCKGFKCIIGAECGGDWDDGMYDLIFKPSDDFIKVAYSYGYHE